MSTITIELPKGLELSEHDAKMMFVAKLYEEGILTPGKGAEMLGITYREFIDTFGFYCRLTPEDIEHDLKTVRQFSRKSECEVQEEKEHVFS